MKHLGYLTQEKLDDIKVGEFFTYINARQNLFAKGLKVSPQYMIPIGLLSETIEGAEKTY